ncbi:MAG: DUF4922 domain-containing protein, partial [Candidatus Omnitrophica bacterium]|nr:DUF4922 domain-containing protein [Candidatus Omnitrophota bacterium]
MKEKLEPQEEKKVEKKEPRCFLCRENMPDNEEGVVLDDEFTMYPNPNPYEKNHIVVVRNEKPGVHPYQIVDSKNTVMKALEMIWQLGSVEGRAEFNLTFNGVGAAASSTHFHYQIFECPLPVTGYKAELVLKDNIQIGYLVDYPAVVMVVEGKDREQIATEVYSVLSALNQNSITYNLLFKVIDGAIRVFIFPRAEEAPGSFGGSDKKVKFGICEMSGMVIVYNDSMANDIIEERVCELISIASYPLSKLPLSLDAAYRNQLNQPFDLLGSSEIKTPFRIHIEQLMGVEDIINDQRLGDDNPEAIALAGSALSYIYHKLLENNLPVDGSLTRQQFNSLFGVRPIVVAGGYASRFSKFIHKCLAFCGMDKSNIALALEGSYCSPSVKPVIAIGDKILGLIVKDEYVTGYNPAKHTFTIDEGMRSSIEERLFVDSKYLDDVKVQEYFGRSISSLIFSYGNFFGHGDAFLRNVMQLQALPAAEQIPFSQLAFGEMSPATDKAKSNASLICYLKMVSGDYLAVSGGKEASRDKDKNITIDSVKGKGNFFKMDSKLVAYTDWEQIPHKADMNKDKPGYDHVFARQAENQKSLEAQLKAMPVDEDAKVKTIEQLRKDYPYFIISDEGELFSQENITSILADLNNWKDLDLARKAYLMRNYAVVDKGETAEILISSNTAIFRNDEICALSQAIQKDFDKNGFASYAEDPSSDNRNPTAFWGVDPKNNETKTLTWNLIRLIADNFRKSNPGKECPVELCYVGKAPSSIKDAPLQLAFAEIHIKDHTLSQAITLESQEALSVLDKIRSNKLDEAVNDMLNNDIASYRRLLRELFAATSRDQAQTGLLKLIGMLEAELNRLISQSNTQTQSTRAPPAVLLGLTIQALAEAIDRGQVANNLNLLTDDPSYRKQAFALRQRFADSSRESHKSEYLIWRLGHILAQALRTQRGNDTIDELLKNAPLVNNQNKSVNLTFLFVTGGTALGTLYVDSLNKAGLLNKSNIYGAVGNVDDGGSSYTIVVNLDKAGYGIIPPPGDQVNGTFGSASKDKTAHILGDGGRVDKATKAKTILEGTLPLVWATLGDENVDLENDFFYFARILAAAIDNVDKLNNKIKTADDAINAANPQVQSKQEKPQDNRISVGGASVRNIFLLGFLANEGFFKDASSENKGSSAVATKEQQDRYARAMEKLIRASGISNFKMAVSSFDPHTLYCIHRDNTLLIKSKQNKDGQEITVIDSLLLRQEGDRVIVYNPADSSKQKELTDGQSISLKDLGIDLGLTAEDDTEIKNISGQIVISLINKNKIRQDWQVKESADLNHTYIVNTQTDEEIELAADGTGRAKAAEGTKEAAALLRTGDSKAPAELFLRNRLIKMQTNITETVNHSEVIDFGFLSGSGLAGVLPADRVADRVYAEPNLTLIELIDSFEKDNVIVIGPGSFFSSILSHFMVKGLPEALKRAKDRGVKVVFVVNANYDNETVNTNFTKQMRFLEDISQFKINKMFSHIVASRSDVLDLDSDLEADFNNGNGHDSKSIAKELIAKIQANPCAYCHIFSMTKGFLKKYADPKSKDYIKGAEDAYCLKKVIGNQPLMEKLAEDYSILVSTLYKQVHPEIRTDPSAAAEAAKWSRGPMVLTPEERKSLVLLPGLTLREHSFISYIRVQKREAGKFTDRIGYDTDIMSELLQEACGIRKALYVVINGNEYHQDQSPLIIYGDKIEVVATRTLPSSINEIKYKDIKEMSATIELSQNGNNICEVSCFSRVLDIRDHQIDFDSAEIENVKPGVYQLKVTTRCMCGEKPDFHQESFSIEVRSGDTSPAQVGAVVGSSSSEASSRQEDMLKQQEAPAAEPKVEEINLLGSSSAKSAFRIHIEQLMGVEDIINDQRLGDDNPEAIALAGSALSYIYHKLLENNLPVDGSLTRQQFNSLFGVRPIVVAGGYASRFSKFIHKCLAFCGMDKSNIALALEGSYCSPSVKPVIAIGDKILGLIVKDEYVTGYNPAKHTFTIDEGMRSSIEERLFVDSKYLDDVKVQEYFGRSISSLIFSYGNFFGHGDAFLRNVMQLQALPAAEQIPFSQLAFGEMSPATDKAKSNASLICYLKMVSGDYLAVSGGKEASRDKDKNITIDSVKGKGNFFKMDSKLVAYTDWEQIPHKADMNKDKPGYDHVFARQAENQKSLEAQLKAMPVDEDAKVKTIEQLRKDYPYFIISDEGELFSQENITSILADLNNWKDLDLARKAYLMRNYAVVDKGETAEILISSNTAIFRNDEICALSQAIQKDFDKNGFASYAEDPSSDNRNPTAFWGVDPKNNETKTLTWNLIRLIADNFRKSNPGKECPVELCYVGKAPSSIKDAPLQLAFAEIHIKDHTLSQAITLESQEALSVLDKIRSNKLDEAVNDMLNNDIASYRRLLRELFAATSRDQAQTGLLKLIGMLEAELNRLISQSNTQTQSTRAPPAVLLGLTIQALAEAIDRGQVANNLNLLTDDPSYRKQAFALRQRFADSSRESHKSEYLIWRLGHILAQALRTQRGNDTIDELLKNAPLVNNQNKSVNLTFLFVTGGTALGTLYVDSLNKAGLLNKSNIYGAVGNVDDGGSSYTIVVNLDKAGYGIIPPPGDQVNGTFGSASKDKTAHILGDGGRVDKATKAKTILEGTLPLVWATLGDENVDLENDFFYFARILAAAIDNVDKLNNKIKTADDAINAANPQVQSKQEKPQDNRISVGGASVRNIFLLGFLANEGFFKDASSENKGSSAVATKEQQDRYARAMEKLIRASGISNFKMAVSSFDPHTLYCIHRDNTLLIKSKQNKDGQEITVIDSLLLRQEGDRVIVYNPADSSKQKELTDGQSISLKDLGIDLGLTAEDDTEIKNISGQIVISLINKNKIRQDWQVKESADLNHTYIVNTQTDEEIELAADGTGRAKAAEGTKEAAALLRTGDSKAPAELFLRNRLIKMQTNITETVNHSEVIDFGFLSGSGLAGVLPADRVADRVYAEPNLTLIELIDSFEKDNVIVIGPGSFFSSILSHFMVKGLPEALKRAKDRGVKVVFVVNANYDNETVNTNFTKQMRFLEDISQFKINKMFSHIVASRSDVLDLDSDLEADFNNGNGHDSKSIAKELIAKIQANPCAYCHIFSMTKGFLKKYADPKSKDYIKGAEDAYCLKKVIGNQPLMEKLAEDYSILVSTLYKQVHPEIRTDPSAAAEAAKWSRGPMVLTPEERKSLVLLPGLTLREHSFISYIRVQKREAGKFTDRIGYDTDIMSELLQEACGIRKALYVVINGNEYHQDQSPLIIYGDKIEVVATRTLPSSINEIKYKDIKEMSATIELSQNGNNICEVSCFSRVLDIRDHQIDFDSAEIENVKPGVYQLKVTTRCMCGEKPDFHQESFSIEVRSGDTSPAQVGAVVGSSSSEASSRQEDMLKQQEGVKLLQSKKAVTFDLGETLLKLTGRKKIGNQFLPVYQEIPGMPQLLSSLKRNGYQIYIFSGVSEEERQDVISNFKFIKDDNIEFIITKDIKAGKTREGFERLLQKLNLKPEELVYVDDAREVIAAASTVGIEAVLFKGLPQLEESLKNLGWLKIDNKSNSVVNLNCSIFPFIAISGFASFRQVVISWIAAHPLLSVVIGVRVVIGGIKLFFLIWRVFFPVSWYARKLKSQNSDVRQVAFNLLKQLGVLTNELKIRKYTNDLSDNDSFIVRDAA